MSETSTIVHRYYWISFLTDQIWLPSRAKKCSLAIFTWDDFFYFVSKSGAFNWYFYLLCDNVFFLPLLLLVLDMIYKHNDHLLMTIGDHLFSSSFLQFLDNHNGDTEHMTNPHGTSYWLGLSSSRGGLLVFHGQPRVTRHQPVNDRGPRLSGDQSCHHEGGFSLKVTNSSFWIPFPSLRTISLWLSTGRKSNKLSLKNYWCRHTYILKSLLGQFYANFNNVEKLQNWYSPAPLRLEEKVIWKIRSAADPKWTNTLHRNLVATASKQ